MRSASLLLGTLAVVACSLDHVVVAALDDIGGANAGGAFDSAGGSSLSSSAGGGAGSAGGTAPQGGDDRISLISGGSNSDVRIGSDAGASASAEVICSCLGQRAEFCGSDGVTYQQLSCDDDAGTCVPEAIACFHACPCLDGEPAIGQVTSWFSLGCTPLAQCAGDVICQTFSGAIGPGLSSCAGGGN